MWDLLSLLLTLNLSHDFFWCFCIVSFVVNFAQINSTCVISAANYFYSLEKPDKSAANYYYCLGGTEYNLSIEWEVKGNSCHGEYILVIDINNTNLNANQKHTQDLLKI